MSNLFNFIYSLFTSDYYYMGPFVLTIVSSTILVYKYIDLSVLYKTNGTLRENILEKFIKEYAPLQKIYKGYPSEAGHATGRLLKIILEEASLWPNKYYATFAQKKVLLTLIERLTYEIPYFTMEQYCKWREVIEALNESIQ